MSHSSSKTNRSVKLGTQLRCRGGIEERGTFQRRFMARVVVQRFTDPHLAHLRRESPTASRQARNFFFGLAATGHMHVHKRDVTATFLQGSDVLQLSRTKMSETVSGRIDMLNSTKTALQKVSSKSIGS